MRIICLLAALLLTACSSQPPKTETYLLRSSVATSGASAIVESGIALDTVTVANYIDQPGLVLTTGDGKVHAARNHIWAEPLQVSLRRYLADQISSASGSNIAASASHSTKTRINVSVDQLHGHGGDAVLVAYWELVGSAGSTSFRFSQQQPLSGDGYDALVDAEQVLLKQLADAISESLPAEPQAAPST